MEKPWMDWPLYVTRGRVLASNLGITRSWWDKLVDTGALTPIVTDGGWRRYAKGDVIRVFGLEEAARKMEGLNDE